MSAGGKGHAPRPYSVPPEEYAASHDRIFGKRPARVRYVPPPLPETLASVRAAMLDVMVNGMGVLRHLPDGSVEHVPLDQMRPDNDKEKTCD